ncbi:MAG: tripartite tricarboxylate transporter TctB family protein [Desulfobacterales bacterium]|nr:tripartite tricarboxylate transporter TctB family protein [Deltaproteobacteria bacterium]NNK94210.1 tripartite tricarboxylate transporter TctB family protein [Desulfobacterales bacterium]
MKVNDAISGIFFILLGFLVFYLTRDFPIMPGQKYGAALFPRLIGFFMGAGGVALIFRGIRMRKGAPWVTVMDWISSPRHLTSFFLVIGVLIFYIMISELLGFIPTGFICLLVLLVWLRGNSTWRSSVVISIFATIIIQQFFGEFLRVPLPWGIVPIFGW